MTQLVIEKLEHWKILKFDRIVGCVSFDDGWKVEKLEGWILTRSCELLSVFSVLSVRRLVIEKLEHCKILKFDSVVGCVSFDDGWKVEKLEGWKVRS
jgi:hypothetical protein